MDSKKGFSLLTAARATAGAMLLGAASIASAAAPFAPIDATWNPTAVGLGGSGSFTFDNIGLRQYAWIDVFPGSPSPFIDHGFLSLTQFTDGAATTQTPSAEAAPYSLYLEFSASGATVTPFAPTFGLITSLSYTLYGDSGITSFVPAGGGTFAPSSTTLAPPIVLGTGTLLFPSPVSLSSNGPFLPPTPGATVFSLFTPGPGTAAFFEDPTDPAMYLVASFTNSPTVITILTPGPTPGAAFRISIDGGGGNATLAIPEPETYAMLLAGLGLMGFVARRRTRKEV